VSAARSYELIPERPDPKEVAHDHTKENDGYPANRNDLTVHPLDDPRDDQEPTKHRERYAEDGAQRDLETSLCWTEIVPFHGETLLLAATQVSVPP